MEIKPSYPSIEHKQSAQAVVDFFSEQEIDAVILTCSCARGKATKDSCLDIVILVSPEEFAGRRGILERHWNEFRESEEVFNDLEKVGKFSHVDLDFTDGCFKPVPRGWTSGPDNFELEIGNTLVYVVPLLERTDYFQRLRVRWLPYYNNELRKERLAEVSKYCFNNLDHIPLFVNRGLYFQAFNRLYHAFQEFLQALFISHRTYPIAYDKWIIEQVADILGMPELYKQLVRLLEIAHFESHEIADKASDLRCLFHEYIYD